MSLQASVVVRRGDFELDVELAVAPGEVVAVMGPNGAGKSTLLDAIAGLVRPTSGSVRVGPRMLASDSVWVPAHRRRVGLLGQDPLLFPHLTVLENVAFAARTAHGGAEATVRAREWLADFGVAEFAGRRPGQLSGGQQQRVAIARALAAEPDVLLLDEPLASLDVEAASRIRVTLRSQLTASARATVIVTHDAVDAILLADRVVLLRDGLVVDEGEPAVMFERPRGAAAGAGTNPTH